MHKKPHSADISFKPTMSEVDTSNTVCVRPASARELQSLYEISQTILDSRDLSVMMDRILDKAVTIGRFDLGLIRLLDPSRQTLEPVANRGYRDAENVSRQGKRMADSSTARAIARVIATKETEVEDLTTQAERMRTFRREGVRTMVTVPLRSKDDVLGVIHVGSRTQRKIEPREIRFLEQIGIQAGIAVQKIRLFEAAERRAKEQEALNEIATAIGQSLHLTELFEIAADKTVKITGRQRINLRLKDPLTGKIDLVACRGFAEEEIEDLRRMTPNAISEQVFASGNPVVINDRGEFDSLGLLARTRSVAWIPVKARASVIGVLGISDDQSKPFSTSELELLQAIGNVIGVAIENARLFEQVKKKSEELETLVQINRDVAALLKKETLLPRIAEEAKKILRADGAVFRVVEGKSLVLVSVSDPQFLSFRTRMGITEGLAGKVVQENRVVSIKNILHDGTMTEKHRQTALEAGYRSFLGVPLRLGSQVIGVLNFYLKEERDFGADEMSLITAFADQAAIAIHNARLYAEIHASRAELARSNAELEQFASVASHDLQEPLRMVTSYMQLLDRRYKGKLDDDANEYIAFAVDGAKRMQALINSLLDYSRIGTKSRRFEPADCEQVFKTALKNLHVAIEESEAIVAHDPLPTVMGDITQLEQLFQNLIGNAIKFRGDKPPAVHVSAARNGKEWVFGFRDEGIGIERQYLERIFVIFQRLHNKEEYPGTGIGLAVCKKIVERHGGRIWVESEPGNGAIFHFTVPA